MKGTEENRASCAQCSKDNHSHSNGLPVPASQHPAATEGRSQPQRALFSTQLEKKLGYQVYARTKRHLLNQNSFKMQDIIKECFDLDSCSANILLSATSHWFYWHSLFNINITCGTHKNSPNNSSPLRSALMTSESTMARSHIEDPAVYTKNNPEVLLSCWDWHQ